MIIRYIVLRSEITQHCTRRHVVQIKVSTHNCSITILSRKSNITCSICRGESDFIVKFVFDSEISQLIYYPASKIASQHAYILTVDPNVFIIICRTNIFYRKDNEKEIKLTLQGTVCGFPILLPQYPRRTGMTESLARMMAPRMAVATSFEHFTPSPIWPLKSPMATKACNTRFQVNFIRIQ